MSRLSNTGFHISRPSGVCSASGRQLDVGERYVAVLAERADSDDLERIDFSLDAWEAGHRPQPPLRALGVWRATVPAKDAKPKFIIDDESLADLFDQLGEQPDPKRLALRFVLALLLIRKKILMYEGSRDGTMLLRRKGMPKPPDGPPLIEVEDPGLDAAGIAAVTEQLDILVVGDSSPDRAGGAAPQAGKGR